MFPTSFRPLKRRNHCNTRGGAGNPAMMMHMRLVRNTDCVHLATRHSRYWSRPFELSVVQEAWTEPQLAARFRRAR